MIDININPCRWHMRIWDVEKNEWLCEHNGDILPYYGFDIRGGEVATIQGMDAVYKNVLHKEFIWEQSTGLKDENGKEIYEGDIVVFDIDSYHNGNKSAEPVVWNEECGCLGLKDDRYYDQARLENYVVIGNIHENPELLEVKK